MWTTPAATEMRFGFEVTMYVMNKQFILIEGDSVPQKIGIASK